MQDSDCQTITQCPETEASADPLPNPHAGKAPTLKIGCEANLLSGQSQTCVYLCFAFVLIRQQSLKETEHQREPGRDSERLA